MKILNSVFNKITFALTFLMSIHIVSVGQNFVEKERLLRTDLSNIYPGEFGRDIDFDGNYAIIGSHEGGHSLTETGIAIIYEYNSSTNSWIEIKRLIPPDKVERIDFGLCVAIEGDNILVTAYSDSEGATRSGSVYVFNKNQGGPNQWGFFKKITAPVPVFIGFMGKSIELENGLLVVGAVRDVYGTSVGAAYVFEKDLGGIDNWGFIKILTPNDGVIYDRFGEDVAISNDRIAVGADGTDDVGSLTGSVYIFGKDVGGPNNWGQMTKIFASNPPESHGFGAVVDMDQNYLLVGGKSYINNAYLFEKDHGGIDNWGEVKRLDPIGNDTDVYFGCSVSIDNNVAIVGACHDNGVSLHMFEKDSGGLDNWGGVQRVVPSNSSGGGESWGSGLKLQGNQVIMGRPSDDGGSGSAYVFSKGNQANSNWNEDQKLFPGEGAVQDNFGESVSMYGDIAVVGIPHIDILGQNSGLAFLYQRNISGDWIKLKDLFPADISEGDLFGSYVHVYKDYIAIGSPYDKRNGINRGAIYLFEKDAGGINNWGETKKLIVTDPNTYILGREIQMNEDKIIAGTFYDTTNGGASGSAHIFQKDYGGINNWGYVKKLIASDAAELDYFGATVSLYDDVAVVGAPSFQGQNKIGASYIFYENEGGNGNWGQVKKIVPGDGSIEDSFGGSVYIQENNLVVGARGDDDQESYSGSAYVFNKNAGGANNWGLVKKILASDGSSAAAFGRSVFISNENILISATGTHSSSRRGSAYLYNKDLGGLNNWGEYQILEVDNTSQFGNAISMHENSIIIGDNHSSLNGSLSGAAYIFEDDGDCYSLANTGFENDAGIWQSGGTDAARVSSPNSPFGDYSLRIRNGNGQASSVYTNTILLNSYKNYNVTFAYQTIGMETNEKFYLELSDNGGVDYVTLKEWEAGVHFPNQVTLSDEVFIPNTISSSAVLRFRCGGSSADDEVFLDNIEINSCYRNCATVYAQSDFSPVLHSVSVDYLIQSNGTVLDNSNIEFSAENSISLLNGFSVQHGAIFNAYISPCFD